MDNYIYIGAGALVFLIIIVCAVVFRKSGDSDDIDEMSGTEFEDFMAEILHRSGIEVLELTKASGDFGADIIVNYEGERTAVQCKRYSRPIGVKAVQEAISSMSYYKCTKAAVITNSTFTRQAEELAAESGVILWDRNDVLNFMEQAESRNGRNAPKRKSYTTLRFHRLISPEEQGGTLTVYINKEEYEILPEKTTVITAETGECRIYIKYGMKKAELNMVLSEGARNFAAGIYKNKPFLEEIS